MMQTEDQVLERDQVAAVSNADCGVLFYAGRAQAHFGGPLPVAAFAILVGTRDLLVNEKTAEVAPIQGRFDYFAELLHALLDSDYIAFDGREMRRFLSRAIARPDLFQSLGISGRKHDIFQDDRPATSLVGRGRTSGNLHRASELPDVHSCNASRET